MSGTIFGIINQFASNDIVGVAFITKSATAAGCESFSLSNTRCERAAMKDYSAVTMPVFAQHVEIAHELASAAEYEIAIINVSFKCAILTNGRCVADRHQHHFSINQAPQNMGV